MVSTFLLGTLTSVSTTLINPYSGEELVLNGDYYMNTTYTVGTVDPGDVLLGNPYNQYWRLEDESGNLLIEDFEIIVPSSGNDILNFASLTNISGDLFIQVADGDDIVWSGAGNDDIGGQTGDDILHGGPGHDIIAGHQNDDVLTGGSGDDSIDGGDDYDIAVYHGDYADYTIVDNAGTFTITDNVGDEGVDTVVNVEKFVFADGFYEGGVFTSTVPEPDPSLTFSAQDFASYTKQDDTVTSTISVVGDTELHMSGNSWKVLDFDYSITSNSYITFDYRTEVEGEVHGLIFLRDGLDPADTSTWNLHEESEFIRLDGTQAYNGTDNLYTEDNGEWQTITVKLSDYYKIDDQIDHLVFVNDDDVSALGQAGFRNIHVFEKSQDVLDAPDNAPVLFFVVDDFEGYTIQDVNASTFEVLNDTELHLGGNSWQALDFDYSVTSNSYVTFDYRTEVEGEVHGLLFLRDGLDPSNTNDWWNLHERSEFIRLDGTQLYNGMDGLYTDESGEWQTITVKLSDYHDLGDQLGHIIFATDDDANGVAESQFRNVNVFESNGIYGDTGDNVMQGTSSDDYLYGGDGADTFLFEAISVFDAVDTIGDFDVSEGDMLNVSDLLSGYDALTDAISDFVQITDNGSDSILSVDVDGGADNFVQIAVLNGITGLSDEDALETAGTLIV